MRIQYLLYRPGYPAVRGQTPLTKVAVRAREQRESECARSMSSRQACADRQSESGGPEATRRCPTLAREHKTCAHTEWEPNVELAATPTLCESWWQCKLAHAREARVAKLINI